MPESTSLLSLSLHCEAKISKLVGVASIDMRSFPQRLNYWHLMKVQRASQIALNQPQAEPGSQWHEWLALLSALEGE